MQIFTTLRKKEGSLHWYGQRITIVLSAPILVWLLIKGSLMVDYSTSLSHVLNKLKTDYSFLTIVSIVLVTWHAKTGIESIIDDYVHNEKTRFLAYISVRLLALLTIKYGYLFICI